MKNGSQTERRKEKGLPKELSTIHYKDSHSPLRGVIRGQYEMKDYIFFASVDEDLVKRVSEQDELEAAIELEAGWMNASGIYVKDIKQNVPFTFNSIEENIASKDADSIVTGNVAISLSDVIRYDMGHFLNRITEELVGTCLLTDISYNVIGVKDGNELVLRVTGKLETKKKIKEDRNE